MTQTPVSTHDSEQDPRNENILIYVDGALVPKQEAFQDPRLSVFGSTVVIIPEFKRASEETAERGLRLHTVPMIRGLPMTQDPKLNSHSKLNCILALIARHVSSQQAAP